MCKNLEKKLNWLKKLCQRNYVFATKSNFLIPITLQPNGVTIFQSRIYDPTVFIVSQVWAVGCQDIGIEN